MKTELQANQDTRVTCPIKGNVSTYCPRFRCSDPKIRALVPKAAVAAPPVELQKRDNTHVVHNLLQAKRVYNDCTIRKSHATFSLKTP